MVRIEVDTSGFRGLMRDPDTRRKMGLALLRDVTAIERRQRGDEGKPESEGMSESEWLRFRGLFDSPEKLESES